MAKFKKGSKAAKDFMAKLRAARSGAKKKTKTVKKIADNYINILGQRVKKGTKLYNKLTAQKKHFDDLQKNEINGTKKRRKVKTKRKVSGEKHTDIKSHNYRINISGLTNEYLNDLNKWVKLLHERKKDLLFHQEQLKEARKRKGNTKGVAFQKSMVQNMKILVQSAKKHITTLKKHI